MPSIINAMCYSVGCYILGSEYTAALGWAVWLIGFSIVNF